MKHLRHLLAAVALLAAATVLAQSASLTSDATPLQPAGGTVTLTATTRYSAAPAALGWSIALPTDWTLVSVVGPNVPQVAPAAGTSGTLEFAYTTSPAGQAVFSVTVQYPAGVTHKVAATPTVIVRANGNLTTLHPAPVLLAKASSAQPANK